ncbi:energy-coupling factor ABC transporter ATP-binding protein [Rhodovulum sulfidophilum]|uniref:ABC transporter ATP-binding protein n=1 Tax=Rhodovulum visakhapatnamense TaxID=364297 RepID=A0ABS1RL66_9RHOB|nr:ABC transporter ATP-binding protein [Rhodovulum visakhapatnamense]MBL3570984.1 ABC transporter ATP-binding protein [Rhodovulum visakhapatnamense]MBL3580421.1 ABC transporter ATP-binding protein [Rhodovulum visakhapatnamense]OLS44658.1 energy-coupling factor ABC transporter ATP-binding protein [Rhodovulum sulfidophilum]
MALFELDGLVFGYSGRPAILQGASLTLEAGQRLSIAGANGSGKSTLLQLMVGLLVPQSGQIRAFGQARRAEPDFHEVRRRAGLVFQDPDDQLFCPTVAEDVAFGPLNLGLGRAAAMDQVEAVLTRLDLMHLKDRVTHRLSGGEKRLVSLAAVLAMEPEVLLLDEPTNALDEENAGRLVAILQGLPQAILLVTHDAEMRAQVAPQGLRMTAGRLVPA